MTGHWRSVGVTELIADAATEPIVVLFALLTQLGDVWFLFLLGGVLYVLGDGLPRWGVDRRRGLFVIGLGLTYVALIGVLKQTFLFPRPPGAGTPPDMWWVPTILRGVFENATTGSGHGFPSGHALGSTLVWGGLALVVRKNTSRRLLGVAGGIVLIVSFSRLVLGVHYLVDVVVGVLLGIVVLSVLYAITDRGTDPSRVLLAAVGIGMLGLLPGITAESVAALGGAVGAYLGWRAVADLTPAHPTSRREIIAGICVLGLAGALVGLVYALNPSAPIVFLGSALAVGIVVVAPLAGNTLYGR